MYILGIDVATRKSGLVVFDTQTRTVVERQTIKIPDKIKGHAALTQVTYQRYLNICTELAEKYEISVVVIEDVLQGAAFLKAALSIHASRTAAVLAVLNCFSHLSHQDLMYYNPQVVKYKFARKRGANKEELLAGLKKMYPFIDVADLLEDELDALALCLYYVEENL